MGFHGHKPRPNDECFFVCLRISTAEQGDLLRDTHLCEHFGGQTDKCSYKCPKICQKFQERVGTQRGLARGDPYDDRDSDLFSASFVLFFQNGKEKKIREWASLGAAPQPMSNVCHRFPIISYHIPSENRF